MSVSLWVFVEFIYDPTACVNAGMQRGSSAALVYKAAGTEQTARSYHNLLGELKLNRARVTSLVRPPRERREVLNIVNVLHKNGKESWQFQPLTTDPL
jgi:hypothetical protein